MKGTVGAHLTHRHLQVFSNIKIVNLLSAMLCISKNCLFLKLTAFADTFAFCSETSNETNTFAYKETFTHFQDGFYFFVVIFAIYDLAIRLNCAG